MGHRSTIAPAGKKMTGHDMTKAQLKAGVSEPVGRHRSAAPSAPQPKLVPAPAPAPRVRPSRKTTAKM